MNKNVSPFFSHLNLSRKPLVIFLKKQSFVQNFFIFQCSSIVKCKMFIKISTALVEIFMTIDIKIHWSDKNHIKKSNKNKQMCIKKNSLTYFCNVILGTCYTITYRRSTLLKWPYNFITILHFFITTNLFKE